MDAVILALNEKAEYYTDELCYINELSNTSTDPDVSIARARVRPGITTRWHRLNGITERYVVIEGQGLVEVGELKPREIKTGDVVLIPPYYRQRISNIGANDLIFLAICSPRFQQNAYEDIADEVNTS